MQKPAKTYLDSAKYRCPICKQWVLHADYLFTRQRSPTGEWSLVESCRKCRDLQL